jgi:hypothetical protein
VKLAAALAALLGPADTAPWRPEPAPAAATPAPGDHLPVNRRFSDLDAYLAYLERRSHLDGAWYRQVRPGVYELQTGRLRLPGEAPRKQTFTREELMRKFGFSR